MGKKKRQRRFIELTKRVMHSMAFDVDHHGLPRVKHQDGAYHVVTGFHYDTLAEIWERVHRSGDTCNVYIEAPLGGVYFFRVTPDLPAGTHTAQEKDDTRPFWLAKDTPMGDLLDRLLSLRDDEVIYRADATGHGLGYLSPARPFLEPQLSTRR